MQSRIDYIDAEFFQKGNHKETIIQFEKLIKESPNAADNPLVRFNLAQCYITTGESLKALINLKAAEEGFASCGVFDDERKQLLWFLKAMMHEKLNELDLAYE